MLNLDSKSTRFLARMGARGTLGQVIYDCMKEQKELYAVTADLLHASGFDRIAKEFPDKLVNVGIAEQSLVGVAAGLADTGKPVVATSWAMFTSARVADQVRNYMGFMQANVKLVGMDSGFMQSCFSYSHTNPPDIAIMRAIPGIVILSPCDGIEIYKAMLAAIEYDGPVYIRLTGDVLMPIVHKDGNFEFEIGKSIELKEGTDVAIIATGNIVKTALDVSEKLQDTISCSVIDMHTIKPVDEQMLMRLSKYKMVVTLEEHLKNGGLGSAVAEFYADKKERPRHIIMGVDDCFPLSGTPEFVQEQCGLKVNQVVEKIITSYNINKKDV